MHRAKMGRQNVSSLCCKEYKRLKHSTPKRATSEQTKIALIHFSAAPYFILSCNKLDSCRYASTSFTISYEIYNEATRRVAKAIKDEMN